MQTMSAIKAAQLLLKEKVKSAAVLLDGTAGNGGDTLFLAKNAPPDAKIYAFDIQSAAISQAKETLAAAGFYDRVEFILASHADLDKYILEKIDAAIFNLGYLPRSSHAITTLGKTTLQAVEKVLEKLSVNGAVAITAYLGHSEGAAENEKLAAYLKNLSKSEFVAAQYKMINHADNAPICYVIERVK
jgi:tRNA1(Val) A37 N6-methylase TrmN6